jgi:hypothetical protein
MLSKPFMMFWEMDNVDSQSQQQISARSVGRGKGRGREGDWKINLDATSLSPIGSNTYNIMWNSHNTKSKHNTNKKYNVGSNYNVKNKHNVAKS